MTSLMVVAGTRPNFVKIAPIMKALKKRSSVFDLTFAHTGQHYDNRMSAVFFDELELPAPDISLGIGSGSHAEQTGRTLIALEAHLIDCRPNAVIVVGDVNSTLAATLAAKKLGIMVAHVEAGLRSHDLSMPEEINRVLTDRISDIHFTTDYLADANLRSEGIPEESVHRVGNVMIDTLLTHRGDAAKSDILDRLGITPRGYALATLHRESSVDNSDNLARLLTVLVKLSKALPIIMPLHPRTQKRLSTFGLKRLLRSGQVRSTEPLCYFDFVKLMDSACFVMTDSGGVQEETTVLGIPCLTLRNTTERPITCEAGTNTIVGVDSEAILDSALPLVSDPVRREVILPLWDGGAAERLVSVLERRFGVRSLSAA